MQLKRVMEKEYIAAGNISYQQAAEKIILLKFYRCWNTPWQEGNLLNCHFVNTHRHGMKGRNIPCDLHMEYINHLCKDAVYGLKANKITSAIVRVGKSLGPLSHLLQKFDKENDVRVPTGAHHKPSFSKNQDMILKELQQSQVFSENVAPRRKRWSFPKVKSTATFNKPCS